MKISRLALFMIVFLVNSAALAQLTKVKKFIKKDVQVVKETRERLVLCHGVLQDSLIITMKEERDSDIYGALEQRRGGNPYRIWIATEKFWNNPKRPKKVWGKLFRAEFIKILRSPKKRLRKKG